MKKTQIIGSKNTLLIVLAFFSIYVFWGTTYLLNKIAVTELPPLMLASVRFVCAGGIILVIAKILKLPLKITKRQLKNTFIAGFLFLTYGNGMFVWALKYVASGIAALIASTQPLIILLLMYIFQGKKLKIKSVVGVVLGILGIFLLINQNQFLIDRNGILAILVIFTCVFSWSLGSLFVANADLHSNFFINTGYQMLIGGVMLGVGSLVLNEPWSLPNTWSTKVVLSIVGLVLFGSIVAFTSFNYLLKLVSTEKVATSAYVNPIVALFLGWYFLDEQITLQSVIATLVLLTGVYFINTKQ